MNLVENVQIARFKAHLPPPLTHFFSAGGSPVPAVREYLAAEVRRER
jgi:hypothetical protein